MTDVTILRIFRTHAQKEYRKVLEIKGTYFLNILAPLLFENLRRIYQNSRLNGTMSKDVKWGVEVEGASSHSFEKWQIALKPMLMFSMHILLPKQSNFKNIRAIWKLRFCNHVN